jgi:hypothetical protein
MDDSSPKTIAINPDDYDAQHVGRTADGRQFFLTRPFEPAIGGRVGREFVALYIFDASGKLLEARIDDFGPRLPQAAPPGNVARVHDQKHHQLFEQRLRELGDVRFERIEIAPFTVDRFGTTFGLIPRPPEDDEGGWWVEVEPGNYMAFHKPWDSGDYDT